MRELQARRTDVWVMVMIWFKVCLDLIIFFIKNIFQKINYKVFKENKLTQIHTQKVKEKSNF